MFGMQQLTRLAQAGALLDELLAAVDDAEGCPGLAQLTGDEAAELFTSAAALTRQVDLLQALTAQRVDASGVWQRDGAAASTNAHLRTLTGESAAWVGARLQAGRALVDHLPATRAAWHAGLIGLTQAAIIRKAVADLTGELRAAMDQTLATAAPFITHADLLRRAEELRSQAAPEASADKAERDFHRQSLFISQTFGGRYRIDGWLNAENGALVTAALEHFAAAPTPEANRPPGETLSLRRALGLVELARQALTHDNDCAVSTTPAKPTVIVTIAHDDLRHQLGIGRTEDGAAVPAAAVRRLACDATILPLQYGTDSQPLDLGRKARLATSGQRYALIYRDRGCLFPHCGAKPSRCRVHHFTHWLDNGLTDLINLGLLCEFHHHAVHEGGWSHTGTPGKDLRFHPPEARVRRC